MGDVEVKAEGSPERRDELKTWVRSDGVWYTKTSNQMMYQCSSTVFGVGGGQRNGLRPTGGPVNDVKR